MNEQVENERQERLKLENFKPTKDLTAVDVEQVIEATSNIALLKTADQLIDRVYDVYQTDNILLTSRALQLTISELEHYLKQSIDDLTGKHGELCGFKTLAQIAKLNADMAEYNKCKHVWLDTTREDKMKICQECQELG